MYNHSQKYHFVYLYDETTRKEGAQLRATMPDWIIQHSIDILREKEREAERAKVGAVAAASLEAAATTAGANSGATPQPPTKGAQTLHAHQVQLDSYLYKLIGRKTCLMSVILTATNANIFLHRVNQRQTAPLLPPLSSPGLRRCPPAPRLTSRC